MITQPNKHKLKKMSRQFFSEADNFFRLPFLILTILCLKLFTGKKSGTRLQYPYYPNGN